MTLTNNSQLIKNILIENIQASPQQRITFAEYMNLVLYHPQFGYYSSGTVEIGSQGDFFTSSSLGTDFGELLAEQFVNMWQILGYPTPFTLIEMGAGSGMLAIDILQYLQHYYPDFFAILEYIIVEQAEGLIERQQALLREKFDNYLKLAWKYWQDIPEDSIIGCCFSNELVDALPVHQIIIEDGQLREIYLTISEDNLIEIIAEPSTPKLGEYFKLVGIDLPSNNYSDGYRTEVNLVALEWVETIAKRLQRGYLLTIDYGYTAQRYYHPQRYQGTLQCYYQHRRHNNPYSNIGHQDITAHVDFTALERQGELWGLKKLGFTQQGMFLMALGLGDRLSALSGGKFNFQEVLKRRDSLHQLIEPHGLGGFGVLVQSKGLTEKERNSLFKGLNFSEKNPS
ncbi:MAG: class I SAM-dependent methyltransferase [Moorea sp. SIO2B7]|nr:class I SAM-dependent methyltransferase [Moorena sp. SIO2B7]